MTMAKTRRADSRQARHCKRKADSSQAKSRQPTTKERTADTISTFFALAAIRLILARATGRVAGPAHRRVAEDRGCRVAGPASRAEAAAGSRYLVLVDKLSQSLQDPPGESGSIQKISSLTLLLRMDSSTRLVIDALPRSEHIIPGHGTNCFSFDATKSYSILKQESSNSVRTLYSMAHTR